MSSMNRRKNVDEVMWAFDIVDIWEENIKKYIYYLFVLVFAKKIFFFVEIPKKKKTKIYQTKYQFIFLHENDTLYFGFLIFCYFL